MAGFGIQVLGVSSLISTIQGVINAYCKAASAVVQATADYARHVEYGTWKMNAQPYMGPAAQDATGSFSAIAGGNDGSIEAIVRAIAEFIAERARMYVPVLTGHLRSTIGVGGG